MPLLLLGLPFSEIGLAHAGGQLEEPIVDAVRIALSDALRQGDKPPEPVFGSSESYLRYVRWKRDASARLLTRRSDLRTSRERDDFLQTVWYNCQRSGLDTHLVLGLIQVESNFRRRAISRVGARGYMQVMPFWIRLLGEQDVSLLFHMHVNVRFGCVILRHYLDREKGDLYMALGRYNGSRGRPEYPNAVFAAQRQWDIPVR